MQQNTQLQQNIKEELRIISNDYANAARYGRYVSRKEEYLRAVQDGRTIQFPVPITRN
jgi:hypothetical protein